MKIGLLTSPVLTSRGPRIRNSTVSLLSARQARLPGSIESGLYRSSTAAGASLEPQSALWAGVTADRANLGTLELPQRDVDERQGPCCCCVAAVHPRASSQLRVPTDPLGAACSAKVAEEIADARFTIVTHEPHVKVAWRVTALKEELP
jgi:hypothetical protein